MGHTRGPRLLPARQSTANQADDRFATIFNQATVGIAQTDLTGHFVLVNDRFCQIVGRTRSELLGGLTMQDITHPAERAHNDSLFDQLVHTGVSYAIEKRYVLADGSHVWVRNSVSLIGDPDGAPRYAMAVSEDITDRKRADGAIEANLRDTRLLRDLGARLVGETASDVLYREILAAAMTLTAADGGTVQILNEHARELTLLASSGFDQVMTSHFGRVDARSGSPCGIALATGQRSIVDFDDPQATDADGSNRLHRQAGYRSAQSTPLISRSGRPVGMLSTHWREHHRPTERELRFLDLLARQAADLIDGKRNEQALRESEGRFRALVEASSDVVYRMSADWSEMRDLEGRAFIPDTHQPNRSWLDIYIPAEDHRVVWATINEAIRNKSAFELEHRVRQVDGTIGWTSSRAVPLLDSNGDILEWFGTASDVTRRREAEQERERLLAAERLAREEAEAAVRTRDEFLATASHDLQSPLSAVKGQAQLLALRLRRDDGKTLERDRILQSLGTIEHAANRMAALIGELVDVTRLELGHTLDLARRPTDLVALAWRVVAERPEALDGERFRVEASQPELIGLWDPLRLERVLGNLLSNATKYSPRETVVDLEIEYERGDDGGSAVVRVRDHGLGIPAADLAHIFERFHRAPNVAGKVRGTGLGLWGTRRIVEQHGGTIEAESEEGRGSTFTVRLPLTPREAPAEPSTLRS